MTKSKNKIVSKYPLKRRTTFKRHTKHYAKVYSPYLPAVISLLVAASILIPRGLNSEKSVLSYASSTTNSSLLDETNEQRMKNGSSRLELDAALATAAQTKAEDMASKDYWSHITPDGKQPWYFIDKAGYHYSEAAENLAYGFGSSKDTIDGWLNSPEHRTAMLNKDFADVGFGIANSADYQGHGHETIVVALYAKSARPDSPKVNASFTDTPASTISLGQIITHGNSPWINLILGVAIGIIAMYLFTKHSLKLRRKIRKGENYILKHPLLDATLLSLLVLMIALSKTAGFIH